MKWSIQQIRAHRKNGLVIDDKIDVQSIVELDREIRNISPIEVRGKGEVGPHDVRFNLNIVGEMTLPCARTLNDVKYAFDLDVIEIFRLDELSSLAEDADVHDVTNNTVDLKPYVIEHILLEKPFRVFSEESEGPAPLEGSGWKLTDESQSSEKKVDPRLEKLQLFLDKKK